MNKNPRKPFRPLVQIFKFFKEKMFIKKYGLTIDRQALKDQKPPYIVIFNHIGYDDHLITGLTLYPHLANFMVVKYVKHTFPDGPFSYLAGAIYKDRYTPDATAVLGAKRVLTQHKGIVAISPAACYCFDGTPQYFDYGIAKLIKMFKVPVFAIKLRGMYFLRNRFRKDRQNAKIKSEVVKVFDEKDIKDMNIEQIYKKLYDACDFNDFTFQEEEGFKVTAPKNDAAKGMEYIIYKCLNCGEEFEMKGEGDILYCKKCQNAVRVNDTYHFEPLNEKSVYVDSIAKWNAIQRKLIDIETQKDDFVMSEPCEVFHYKKGKKYGVKKYGEGIISLDKNGFKYVGTDYGKDVELIFPLMRTPSIGVETTVGVKNKMYIVFDGQDYVTRFVLKNMTKAIKFQQCLQYLRYKYYPDFAGQREWMNSRPSRIFEGEICGAKPQIDVFINNQE